MRLKWGMLKSVWMLIFALGVVACSDDVADDGGEEPGSGGYAKDPSDTDASDNTYPMVATINFAAEYGDKEANLAKMVSYATYAGLTGVDIIVFPELALTGHSFDSAEMASMAESTDGDSATTLSYLADEYNMYIAYGAPEILSGVVYNSLFVCTPAGDVVSYQSIWDDKSWSTAGSELKMIDTQWGSMGLTLGIEYFAMPEMCRIYSAVSDCFLILNPTSVGEDDYVTTITNLDAVRTDECSTDYYAETTEDYYRINVELNTYFSGVFVVHSNLAGDSGDEGETFIGSSLIMGPSIVSGTADKYLYLTYIAGEIGDDSAGLIISEVNTSKIKSTRLTRSSLFQPDLYKEWYASLASSTAPTVTDSSDPVVAVVNMTPAWADKAANYEEMKGYIEDAASQGVDIIVFPELVLADYASTSVVGNYKWISMIDNAENVVDGEYALKFLELAKEHDMYIVYGTSEENDTNLDYPYNSAFVADPNKNETVSYQKIHPVEGNWCSWGTTPVIVDTPWGGMGLSVCKDTYSYPELSRYYALAGCRFLINPTASITYASYNFVYNGTLSTCASRDRMLALSSDLVGACAASDDQPKSTLAGKSVIIGNEGTSAVYYSTMSSTEEAMYVATPDMTEITGLDASDYPTAVLAAGFAALVSE
ncbi:MAG: carbon-nitrogen hydrolase family protein [Rikenellaceae bacterium]